RAAVRSVPSATQMPANRPTIRTNRAKPPGASLALAPPVRRRETQPILVVSPARAPRPTPSSEPATGGGWVGWLLLALLVGGCLLAAGWWMHELGQAPSVPTRRVRAVTMLPQGVGNHGKAKTKLQRAESVSDSGWSVADAAGS